MNEIVEINIGWLVIIVIIIGFIVYILFDLRKMLNRKRLYIVFLNEDINDLEKEKSKLSNALREKGIEVDQLEKKIKRYKEAK
ncbi:MAG: hypothetical protein E3J87_07365 [Candidatus Cloacimonadota bacterium]|nr:MAG: hypothetical protein E3J87_07365 [Candidatus Cloacimonadota bacterium]